MTTTNSTGFSALPGGWIRNGVFATEDIGAQLGSWWTTTDYMGDLAWKRDMFFDRNSVFRDHHGYKTSDGSSVRCIKDRSVGTRTEGAIRLIMLGAADARVARYSLDGRPMQDASSGARVVVELRGAAVRCSVGSSAVRR